MSTLRVQLRRALGIVLLAGFASGGAACRTTERDVHHWARTVNGPRKLEAVLTHDKYPMRLRVEAAVTLIRMEPRKGRHIGLLGSDDKNGQSEEGERGAVRALADIKPEARAKIVDALTARLVKLMEAPPRKPPKGKKRRRRVDPSMAAKDAAFALLTYEDAQLVTGANRDKLRASLVKWCSTDFAKRIDDTSQVFGVEQVLEYLKADGVRPLVALVTKEAAVDGFREAKLLTLARLFEKYADKATRAVASQRYVEIAKFVEGEAWRKAKTPDLEAANKASSLTPSKDEFAAQLAAWQKEEVLRVFTGLKAVGGTPVVNYLLSVAQDEDRDAKTRLAALMALQNNIDTKNEKQVEAILALATGEDTPDPVRAGAFLRTGELPREKAVPRLYKLFDSLELRPIAAGNILKMSELKHMDEFMAKYGKVKEVTIHENLANGALIAKMDGDSQAVVEKYSKPVHPLPVRLTALGYWYSQGAKNQVDELKGYAAETTKLGKVRCDDESDGGCQWQCGIPKKSKDKDGKEVTKTDLKDIETVGDFVSYCIVPAMKKRDKAPEKDKKKSGAKKAPDKKK